eukprot:CAMPEP_0172397588 /NCGR_PEP_ID=MMETSP1061-20121228/31524_1 /TAXON_ID=37318 /ORGANISM="Pseudo-nitzschia pungens, Strain cf. pungens" /LENGTH=765 /DNA_ID=CAMNT_0013129817 /DNA_START=80 /DNA_END=2377 /DNA_ORIENTATION=+
MSGLLGFRSSRRASAPARTTITQEEGVENGVSIVSIVSDRSMLRSLDQKPRESRNSANLKHKKQQQDAVHCAQSVMSDCSFNTMPATLLEDVSPDDDDIEDFIVDPSSTNHAFLVECSNGEQIYVPSWQGRIIKARCRHFRVALGGRSGSCTLVVEGGGGGSSNKSIDSNDSINEEVSDVVTNEPKQQTFVMDNRVVPKKNWSPRTARHILEILTDGTTWIGHESSSSKHHHRRFVELLKACDELAVRLCLGSVINHHDVLDPASSLRFFQLSGNATLHRFKLSGTIRSWQWMQLLRSGVLLNLNSTKVLMLSSQESEGISERGRTQQRLSKCDDLYSEFSVYSEKSKMNTLYTIFDLLSTTATSVSNQNARKGDKTQNRSGTTGGSTSRSLDESFRIIFRTEKGGLHEEDMNNLWRMTSASYTMSTPDESGFLLQLHKKRCNELQLQSHLQSAPVSSNSRRNRRSISNNRALANFPPPPNIDEDDEDDEDDHDQDEENNVATTGNVSGDEEDSVGASSASYTTSDSYLDNESVDEPPTRTIRRLGDARPSAAGVDVHPSTPSSVTDAGDHHLLQPNSYDPCRQQPTYETRTISGTSVVVLRHLFDPINSILHRHRSESKGGHSNNINTEFRGPSDPDPSRLPACLSISNPTPDTLGRFLNACTSILGGGGNNSGGRSEGAGAGAVAATAAVTPTIGYHFVPSSSFSFSSSNTVRGKRDAAGTVFFVSGTSRRMKEVLAHMADYSQTSVVGDADFQLEQFRRRRE